MSKAEVSKVPKAKIIKLLQDWPEATNVEIAKRLGCTEAWVRMVRKENSK